MQDVLSWSCFAGEWPILTNNTIERMCLLVNEMAKSLKVTDMKKSFIESIGLIVPMGKDLKLDETERTLFTENFKTILITSIGMIECEITNLGKELDDEIEKHPDAHYTYIKLFDSCLKARSELLMKDEENPDFYNWPSINQSKAILLKNVTIHHNVLNNKVNMPYLWIFSDQIIGVTYGAPVAD